jgi:Flp pilus assembly protein TadG
MFQRALPRWRRGAAVVEFAFVAPLLFLLIFVLIVGGLGIFRYHQVASLAREAARYASVHGLDYARETRQPAATQTSILKDVVLPNAVGLDPSRLTCAVTWDKSNAPKYPAPDGTVITNVVTVTVSYQWVPEAYLGGITLSSTSTMPMSH